MRILITGSTGFIGQGLINEVRNFSSLHSYIETNVRFKGLVSENFFYDEFFSVDVVVHLAGLAHGKYSFQELETINYESVISFAKAAIKGGVKRFIFISSVNAGLEGSSSYDVQKQKAENALTQMFSEKEGTELVIIRSPLVYGPGCKANFYDLLKLCDTSAPLPFGLVNNRRSMVYLGNLADFIIRCIDHPEAANQIFLISDEHDLSLSKLIRIIREAMNKPAWLVPVPISLLRLVGKLTGKMALVDRLVSDLQFNSNKARQLLDWNPPYTVEQGIKETVADFNRRKQ